jgi:hypothetical protein
MSRHRPEAQNGRFGERIAAISQQIQVLDPTPAGALRLDPGRNRRDRLSTAIRPHLVATTQLLI